jgi:type III secretion system-like peptide-binding chaperone
MIEHWIARHGSTRLLGRVAMVGVIAMTLLLRASAAPAAKKDAASPDAHQISAFIDKWRCPVAIYLQGIHGQPQTNKDRYLVLWPKGRPAFYVQCMFHDDDQEVLCEAASGSYERAGSFATPARLDALAGLGFATDGSRGNWAQEHAFHSGDETATLMLETLARVFAASADDTLLWSAPLLSKHRSNRVNAGAECAPVSMVEPSAVAR